MLPPDRPTGPLALIPDSDLLGVLSDGLGHMHTVHAVSLCRPTRTAVCVRSSSLERKENAISSLYLILMPNLKTQS